MRRGTPAPARPIRPPRCSGPGRCALIAIAKPSPSSPTRFAAGTSQSSKVRIPVFPARTPSLPWSDSLLNPGNERSTMKAVIPLWPLLRSTLAKTRTWSAVSARLIQILRAVEDVAVAVPPGGAGEVRRIGADARLGQAEGRQLLAARLRDEVLLLLLLAAPLEQRQRVQAGVDAEDDPEGGVRSLHLLAQQGEGDVVHSGAAVALRDRAGREGPPSPSSRRACGRRSPSRRARGCAAGSRARRRRARCAAPPAAHRSAKSRSSVLRGAGGTLILEREPGPDRILTAASVIRFDEHWT